MACTKEELESGKCKQSSKSAPSLRKNKPKSKVGEKIAANQRLPYENLLEEFLRQEIAPDPNDGNNYYLGKVVATFFEDDNSYDVYDIFNDSVSNIDRFFSGKKIDEKKVNKIIVHIPELFSTREIPNKTDLLNYYTKFKINFLRDDKIKVDDVVKVTFKNSKDFTDPEIISIYRSNEDSKIEVRRKILKESFDGANDCRILQLRSPTSPTSDRNSIFSDQPIAGYKELKKSLDTYLGGIGYLDFRKQIGEVLNYDLKLSTDLEYKIFCDPKIQSKYQFKGHVSDTNVKPPLPDKTNFDVVLRLSVKKESTLNPKNTLNDFSKYIDEKLSKYKFIVKKQDYNANFASLDIIVDIAAVPFDKLTPEKSILDQYIEASDNFSGNFTTNQAFGDNVSSQQTGTSIVTANLTNQECENKIPANISLYIPISDKKRWKRSFLDGDFVNYFFSNNDKTISPIKYFGIDNNPDKLSIPIIYNNLFLSGELLSKKNKNPFVNNWEDLKNKNIKFYSIPSKVLQKKNNKIKINSNFKSINSRPNFITEQALATRIQYLADFLEKLREFIAVNEGVPIERVLILPINVIRVAEKNSDSRHQYGQAVDFVVYLNFSDDPEKPEIYQISPEIVYLYCRKRSILTNQKENTGNGVFIDDQYNHFEFLSVLKAQDEETPAEVKKGLPKDIIQNGSLWVVSKDIDPKKLDQPSKNLEEFLVNYILERYTSVLTGAVVEKIIRLK